MAPDFKSHLATEIIAEKHTVTYRNVSRALNVHVNAAKCMLYEFHKRENEKKPGSIYATYLISGFKKPSRPVLNGKRLVDDDEPIPSSPPPFTSSMLEPSQQTEIEDDHPIMPLRTITLAREEAFADAKKQYESISSIHIYSLSPGRLPDLVALTDTGRELFTGQLVKDDDLKQNKIYGIIQNPGARKRKSRRPNLPGIRPAEQQSKAEQKKKPVAQEAKATTKENKPTPAPATTKEESKPNSRDSTPTAQPHKPTLKKESSSLFKAFAKQSAKPKLERKDTDASTNASVSGADDVKMTGAEADDDEEGESDDEALFLDTNTRKPATRKRPRDTKKESEENTAKLQKMMDIEVEDKKDEKRKNKKMVDEDDEEDEEENALPNVEDASSIKDAPPAAQGESLVDDVEWSDSDGEKKDSKPAAAPKRRRGRRQVPKNRTYKDEEGYLVTKEELVWEDFSEDEPESKPTGTGAGQKLKTAFSNMNVKSQSSSQKSATPASTKEGTKKKGGSIMSFFAKK